jgi:hypothetical protein
LTLQTVRGGRAGPTFHSAGGRGGRTIGTKRSILIEILGLPLAPLYKVEHAFACLGRWRRLSGCYEGTEASARAWLEVVCVAYLFVRLRAEPT